MHIKMPSLEVQSEKQKHEKKMQDKTLLVYIFVRFVGIISTKMFCIMHMCNCTVKQKLKKSR